jgi:hypothetical protein
VPEPRELRSLVPAEVAAVLAIAIAPLPEGLPVALPLVVAATIARWIRRRSWGELVHGSATGVWVGGLAGLAALGLAVLAGTPVIEAASARAIEWSAFPVVRGNAQMFAMAALLVTATAIASELALRGWLLERMLELSPGPVTLPVFAGALAEAIVTPGDLAARAGAGLFGAGLGWMYVAGGRSLVAPVCARVAFALGALALEAMRVIG